ncbi:MAG: glycoside hydrolase family 95 protein [Ruminococcaceae bacterium]|nr:glycoside hydrolase family 95 protein [Oscillospiraceae bacterium]
MFLCYKEPAHMSYLGWENQALPLGNGKIGAKVFGGKACELIHFNEKTLWSGGGDVEGFCGGIKNGDRGEALGEIQALLDKGDTAAATDKMKKLEGDMTGFGAYQSFMNLYIQLFHGEETEKYLRDLDLDTASAMVSYQKDKVVYTRHYFVSYPDNVFAGKIDCENKLKGDEEQVPEDAVLTAEVYVVPEQSEATVVAEGNTIKISGTVSANTGVDAPAGKDKNSMKYGATVSFYHEGGEISAKDGRIILKDVKSFTFIASLATDYINSFPVFSDGSDPLEKASAAVERVKDKSFSELYKTHIADYKSLYNRVKFNLGEQDDSILPTDYMLKRFEKTGEFRRNLITLLFQYGRYLLIASSRDGSLPANLQGIWNAKNDPPWCCDYHFNVNVQMNYWPAYVANLAETALPYIDFVNSLRKPGRIIAAKSLGIGEFNGDEVNYEKPTGWMIHTMVTPLGFVGPGSSWRWGWAPTNGAWALQNCFDYYLFTGDINKLKNDIYPAMQECALMWTQLLHEDKKTGRLVCSPGYSPEHGPVSQGNTYDQSIICNLYEDLIIAADELEKAGFGAEVNKDIVEKVKQQKPLLKPVNIGKWGQIKEWYEEDSFFFRGFCNKGVQKKHRHLSHMLTLYPFRQIDTTDEKMKKAALTSLRDRGMKSTGWGLAVRLLSYARLHQGNDCEEIITNILKKAILKNLFGTHPPFQIDGNFGYTAGVCEMLLQSHLGFIQLLPALPVSWKNGEITGICARGGFEVDMTWADGRLRKGKVKSLLGNTCSIAYDGKVMLVEDENGNEVATAFENGVTTFSTEKGKVYSIS